MRAVDHTAQHDRGRLASHAAREQRQGCRQQSDDNHRDLGTAHREEATTVERPTAIVLVCRVLADLRSLLGVGRRLELAPRRVSFHVVFPPCTLSEEPKRWSIGVCVGKRFAVGWRIVLPFKIIYHHRYDLNLGAHVFPSQKFRLIHERLLADKIASFDDFLTPEPASDTDVLRVHTPEYVHKLKTGTLSAGEIQQLEIPYSPELVTACWLAAGGSILAGRRALADGYAANIGGGFHHACPDHGEGFCAIHDVAIAIRRLQFEGAIGRAMVVDTDVHQGNGTAVIFNRDTSVFTLSIHQENNYPFFKPPSTVDIDLRDGIGDDDYLAILERHLRQSFLDFSPDLLFYIAGADPYREDQLGGLALTLEGLARRDALVFDLARRNGVPAASALAGGYARRLADTVGIHVGTILAARDQWSSQATPAAT